MKVSASDLGAWKYCPRDFYYRKVEGKTKPPNENLVKGILIHSIYKDFFDRKVFSDAKYFEWFLSKGIDRFIEGEEGRIKSIGMDREELRSFLIETAKGLNNAVSSGEISLPSATELRIESDEFIARVDALFEKPESVIVADVKIRLRSLEGVKLQLAVAAIIFESQGKKVEKGLAIDAEKWQQVDVPITEELKNDAREIREKILEMFRTKEKPPCTCGRCIMWE